MNAKISQVNEQTSVQIFSNPSFGQVRTAGTPDNPLFCLADICKAVGLTNPSAVKSRLDTEDVQVVDLHALNSNEGITGNSKANFVNESGFYDVLLQSSSQSVKPFRKWITSEVLPSIRKNGGYIATTPEMSDAEIMAKALMIGQATIERMNKNLAEKESTIKELTPKANYTDLVLQSDKTYTFSEVGKDVGMRSGHRFIEVLLYNKVIFKSKDGYLPTAKYSEQGLFAFRTSYFVRKDKSMGTNTTLVMTEKGRRFAHAQFSEINHFNLV